MQMQLIVSFDSFYEKKNVCLQRVWLEYLKIEFLFSVRESKVHVLH